MFALTTSPYQTLSDLVTRMGTLQIFRYRRAHIYNQKLESLKSLQCCKLTFQLGCIVTKWVVSNFVSVLKQATFRDKKRLGSSNLMVFLLQRIIATQSMSGCTAWSSTTALWLLGGRGWGFWRQGTGIGTKAKNQVKPSFCDWCFPEDNNHKSN